MGRSKASQYNLNIHQTQCQQHRRSALTLFVARVGTDHPNHAVAMDDLAFRADLFHRGPNFHTFSLFRPLAYARGSTINLVIRPRVSS